ncbi:MAG: thiamine pyrophosphate-binding protein [Chloroflexota bacterium]|nr:thiamine pyrophosphate-binding protein [Chloroflexota bacterium]
MRLTGSEIIVEHLIAEGVPYVAGIPGHGCLALFDALKRRQDKIRVIQVRHEQAAVHLADGYYRVKGEPLAVVTSIGPGAINTGVGLATSYVDSTAVLVVSGETHTYMFGRGVLQEIERANWADLSSVLAPLVKRYWKVTEVAQLMRVMPGAFNVMREGRPGPAFVSMPMNVQADDIDITMPVPATRKPFGRQQGDPVQIQCAAELLWKAKRPVILAGGGVNLSGAFEELRRVAEHIGAPAVTTLQSKGCFPEDHPLNGWHAGSKGTTCGNALTRSADVVLAVGCRFADETTSSYRQGVSFGIPPTRLVHIDIDSREIGKNYATEVGIVADAKAGLAQLLDALAEHGPARDYRNSAYFRDVQRLQQEWAEAMRPGQTSERVPVTVSRFFRELRQAMARDGVLVTSSGHAQATMLEFPFYEPRTNITTGGFSTMGFSLPAALGAKLAAPDKQVVAVVGDGDFLMTCQELATAVQYQIPIVVVVLNNMGWHSIRDLQIAAYGQERAFSTDFVGVDGVSSSPDFAALGKAFGVHSERIQRPDEVQPAVKRALALGGPALVEVLVNREYPHSGSLVTGWWDVPVPAYLEERRRKYLSERAEEQLS